MRHIQIRLLGKLSLLCDGQDLAELDLRRVKQLVCYLLLYRDRSHAREVLASVLWGDAPTMQARKYLRQALWQLQSIVTVDGAPVFSDVFLIDAEWIQFNPAAPVWLDSAQLEHVYQQVRLRHGQLLTTEQAREVAAAVELYRGDLLEGWYQDWCVYERERLQNHYLMLLDKLMEYSETANDYEEGLSYGERILRIDRARERTHRQMMRLHHLLGDRTGALRQYARCVNALREDLDVEPGQRTQLLLAQIQADQPFIPISNNPAVQLVSVQQLLHRLQDTRLALSELQQQIQLDIQLVEQSLAQAI